MFVLGYSECLSSAFHISPKYKSIRVIRNQARKSEYCSIDKA